jgi:hypothetical protein
MQPPSVTSIRPEMKTPYRTAYDMGWECPYSLSHRTLYFLNYDSPRRCAQTHAFRNIKGELDWILNRLLCPVNKLLHLNVVNILPQEVQALNLPRNTMSVFPLTSHYIIICYSSTPFGPSWYPGCRLFKPHIFCLTASVWLFVSFGSCVSANIKW